MTTVLTEKVDFLKRLASTDCERISLGDPVILVSGLPRSGTSMMMQMLEAGGVEVLCDGQREADDDNPRGYYELEAVKQTREDPSWLEAAGGKAVKLISQLLHDLPEATPAKVLFLRREMGEILASQRKMLERRGESGAGVDDGEMARIFAAHVEEVLAWARGREGVDVLEVQHAEVLGDPAGVARQVADFVGGGLDVAAMAGAVDGGLHRNRRMEENRG